MSAGQQPSLSAPPLFSGGGEVRAELEAGRQQGRFKQESAGV